MNAIFMFLGLITLSATKQLSVPSVDSNLDDLWSGYKTKFGKTYESEKKEIFRRLIWERNVRRISKHNFESDLGQHTYTLGINKYTDMEPEEFNKVMKGLRFHNNINYNSSVMFMDDNVTGLPAEVDWRKEGYVTEVKDQGRCGSCWAFAATGSLEGQLYKKIGKLVSLSEQDLVDCAGSCGTDGCNGGLMQPAYECIKKMGGIESEKDYPYEGKDNKCRFSKKKSITTLSGYMNFKRFDEKALQKAVTHFGPIAAAIDTSDPKFSHYKTGIFQSSSCSPIYLDHAVLVVGYGTENGKDFWLVKNSWGLSWGMNGYFKIARNQNNTCGIASYTCCPIV